MNYKELAELSGQLEHCEHQLQVLTKLERQLHIDNKGIHVTVEHEMCEPQYDDSEFNPLMMMRQFTPPPPPYDKLDPFYTFVTDIEASEIIYALMTMTQIHIKRLKRQLNQLTK